MSIVVRALGSSFFGSLSSSGVGLVKSPSLERKKKEEKQGPAVLYPLPGGGQNLQADEFGLPGKSDR